MEILSMDLLGEYYLQRLLFFTLPSKVEFFSVLVSMTICFIFSLLCLQGKTLQIVYTVFLSIILDVLTAVISGGICGLLF